ncbi:hypothetical protein FQA47_016133 [Oryzias melastigma]|uniref:Uncharacterized protein n=1 Tax=Oryzias melastigma TaxID=30732 RepID=A0A834FTD0_ORYME|nr:hypothetical protein FQA47_016133 [Oryzias melastigma]
MLFTRDESARSLVDSSLVNSKLLHLLNDCGHDFRNLLFQKSLPPEDGRHATEAHPEAPEDPISPPSSRLKHHLSRSPLKTHPSPTHSKVSEDMLFTRDESARSLVDSSLVNSKLLHLLNDCGHDFRNLLFQKSLPPEDGGHAT